MTSQARRAPVAAAAGHDDAPALRGRQAWRRVLRHALAYPRDLAVVAVAGLVTAAADVSFPLVTRHLIDELVERGAGARVLAHGAAYGALAALLATAVAVFIRRAGKLSTHVSHDIRVAGFARLQRLSFGFFDRRPVGWLVARMTSDCDRLARILAWGTLDIAWGSSLLLGAAGVLLVLDWRLGLAVLAVVPVMLAVGVRFQRLILGAARRVRRENSRLTAAFAEALAGVRTTKVLVREEDASAEFDALARGMRSVSVQYAHRAALQGPMLVTLGSLGAGAALWLGGARVEAGTLTLGTLVAFMAYAVQLLDPVRELANLMANVQVAQAAAERVASLLETEPEVRDSPMVAARVAALAGAALAPGVAPDGGAARVSRVELRGVGFSYVPGHPVLEDVDLVVPAGRTVALVGPTGGGKTTLVGLLARFYEPTVGRVLLDGVDYRERSLDWWQGQLAVVSQQPWLFGGTVRENVRYGRLEASDAEVERAVALAGASLLLGRLERGLDTEVGEGGSRLSAGERQLVSLARAILADRPFLILDEATSSVDAETELAIQRGLAQVVTGRTSFVIAHRLSTIRRADLIVVVEGGRIVERGTHRELVAGGGRYADLSHLQGVEAWMAAERG
jgi:ATP-binding cassette subfamily B protein